MPTGRATSQVSHFFDQIVHYLDGSFGCLQVLCNLQTLVLTLASLLAYSVGIEMTHALPHHKCSRLSAPPSSSKLRPASLVKTLVLGTPLVPYSHCLVPLLAVDLLMTALTSHYLICLINFSPSWKL